MKLYPNEMKILLFQFLFVVTLACLCISCDETYTHSESKVTDQNYIKRKELYLQLSETQPSKENYYLYRDLINNYINDISNKTFELDSIFQVLEIENMVLEEKSLFLKQISIYLLNLGKMDSAETVLRKIYSHPPEQWSNAKVELEFNGNMVLVKMGLNHCDSALLYVKKLDHVINSSDYNFNAEEIRFAEWITELFHNECQ